MGLIYVLRFPGGFRDGNVWPEFILPGRTVEVDEATYKRFLQSEPDLEIVETKVPPSTKAPSKKK